MKGITYYKLQSPYDGDITKNCSLDGFEVDQNFFNLSGRDIESLTINGTELTISLINGKIMEASLKPILDEYTDTTYGFDVEKGILSITQNGITKEVGGFVTLDMLSSDTIEIIRNKVSVNNTLYGNGEKNSPIGVAPTHQTGVYKPVIKLVDETKGEFLPSSNTLAIGDRFITCEYVSDYGLLYNYEGVKRIACDLVKSNSGWRIPTKEDWDDMLNAIELNDKDKLHGSAMSNKYLGQYAGKFLKSKDMWINEECTCSDEYDCSSDNHSNCVHNESCDTPFYGEVGKHHVCCGNNNKGIDKFCFNLMPVGYADECKYYQYFKERTWLWTATNQEYTNAYTKRFDYNKSKVYQDIVPTDYYLSLRLIKDYTGDNFKDNEEILGSIYQTVLMPSEKNGKSIWTSTNIALSNSEYKAILPNDGQNIKRSKHYFVNEWDGSKWLRNEIREGESVVIKDSPDANHCVEYRVIDNNLVNVSSIVYDDVMKSLIPEIERVETLIDIEKDRANEAELVLSDKIDAVKAFSNDVNIKLDDTIVLLKQEVVNRENTIENLKKEFNEQIVDTQEKIGNLHNEIEETNSHINVLKEQLVEFKQTTEENIITLSKKDDELLNEINVNKTNISNLEDNLSNLNEKLNQNKENIETQISNAVSDLTTSINETNSNLSNLEENLNNFKTEVVDNFTTVSGKLPSQNGTQFNTEDGILTIKSSDGTNDIKIQMTFNFGEI